MQAVSSQLGPNRQQPEHPRHKGLEQATNEPPFTMPPHAAAIGVEQAALGGLPAHGGQVQAVMRLFPQAPKPYYDLSTGISPFAYPCTLPPAQALHHLPEQHEEDRLLTVAAQAYGVADPALVVAGAGSQSLIAILPFVIPAQRVCILGPTYSGHEQAWRLRGIPVECVTQPQALVLAAHQPGTVCIVCNPNNPDGRIMPAQWLLSVATTCANNSGFLIVDEAFADFENQSVAGSLPHPALGVLRSFGKTYGLPGIRLGFLLAAPPLAAQVRATLGSWPVGTLALHVGAQALADSAWRSHAAQQAKQAHTRLVNSLHAAGLKTQGQCSLFTLVRHAKATKLWQHLCQNGLVTRVFSHTPDALRIGLPASAEAWVRLETSLATFDV